MASQGKRCVCVREIAAAIDGSMKTLLADVIETAGFTGFNITDKKIRHISGGEITFKGLKGGSHNETRTRIKGLEGVDGLWFEEAEGATEEILNILFPTFERNEHTIEIYTYNRYFRKDPIHRELVLSNDDTVEKININYWDNPFIADKMIKKAEIMKVEDYDKYQWVYGGQPKISSTLRVFHNFKIDNNTSEKNVQHYSGVETWTMWDFGVSDPTAIAVVQIFQHPDAPNGVYINFISEHINRNKSADYYKQWVMDHDYFDRNWRHAGDPAGAARSHDLTSWVTELGPEIDIEYTHGKSISEYIDLANKYMPSVRISETQCPQFYDMFTNWEFPDGGDGQPKEGSKPKHDVYSHPGTAFYYFIMERFNPDNQYRVAEIRI